MDNKSLPQDFNLIFISVYISLLMLLVFSLYWNKNYYKRDLTKFYKVDAKTFNKWIKYFAKDCFPDYHFYLKLRKLSLFEYQEVTNILGDPSINPVLSKKDVILKSEGSYRSLRESVRRYPDCFGITVEAFQHLRKFPPNISKRMLEQYL